MNFSDQDREVLTKTILIGMPAVGKTALTGYLRDEFKNATKSEIDVVSTDDEFKKIRQDPENKLVQSFIASHGMSKEDAPFNSYHVIEKYGEKVFRDFESAVIIDLLNKGEFKGKMVNLGGKAILHPETSKALKDAGYSCIYLKADSKILMPHVMKDFYAWLNGASISRSNVNMPIKLSGSQKLKECTSEFISGKYFSNQDYKAVLKKTRKFLKKAGKAAKDARNTTARTIIAKMLYERDSKYAASATETICVEGDIQKDARKIMSVLRRQSSPLNIQAVKNGQNAGR